MFKDPIIAELRRVRDNLAARFNYDAHALCEYLRGEESKRLGATPLETNGNRAVSRKPRRRQIEAKQRIYKDPIVAEVRAAGDRLARRFDYDLRALFEFLREEECKRKAAAGSATKTNNSSRRKPRKTVRKAPKRAR